MTNDGSYREVKAEQDHRPHKGAWAPGNYFCTCVGCGNTFLGEKRAHECAPCAYEDRDHILKVKVAAFNNEQ